MKITKKTLLITSLCSLAAACILLILAIFGVKVFEGAMLRVLLIASTLAVGCGIANFELNVLEKRKVLGIVSISLLGLSVLLALIIFCTPIFVIDNWFNRITGVVAIFSVLFAVITSLNTKMERRCLPLQIVTYAIASVTTLLIALMICSVKILSVKVLSQIFWVLCVLTVGLLVAVLVVSGKRQEPKSQKVVSAKQIDNTLKAENESLKEQIELLKAENQMLKEQIESLKTGK
jgi:cell division protein FtsB